MVNLSFFLVFPFLSHQSWTPGMSVRSRRSATVTARGEKGGRWRDGGVKNRRHGAQLLGRGGCHASATQQTNGWQLINGDTMEIRKISQTHIINYVYIYVYMYVYIYIYMCVCMYVCVYIYVCALYIYSIRDFDVWYAYILYYLYSYIYFLCLSDVFSYTSGFGADFESWGCLFTHTQCAVNHVFLV